MRRATVFPISTMKEDNTHHSHCGATHTKSDVTNDTPVQSNCSKDKQKYTQCATYVAFEPIFWGLRIAGLFYEHRQQSTLSASACAGVSVMQVYCCITMSALVLLFLVGVGMTSALLTSLEPAVVLLFIGIMLMGECAANALSMFRACCSKKGLKKFFGAICNLEKYGGPLIPPSTTHNLVVASCVVGWAVVVFGTAFEVYIIVFTAFFEETLQSYFPLYENLNNNVIKTAYILCEAYFWTMWAWMNIFQLAVSAWLYCEFHHLRRVLSRQLTTHSGELNSDWLEVSRKRFIEMTRIVRAADECFSLRIAASFGCNIISICLLLYSIIYHPEAARQPASLPSYACWLCISVADLTLSCVSGILVIAQVDKIRDRLQRISLDNVTTSFAAQVNMFMTMLNNRTGLTVGGLFIIDQNVILSLVGLIVTYFLIVVQFASSSSPSASSKPCNCSCIADSTTNSTMF